MTLEDSRLKKFLQVDNPIFKGIVKEDNVYQIGVTDENIIKETR